MGMLFEKWIRECLGGPDCELQSDHPVHLVESSEAMRPLQTLCGRNMTGFQARHWGRMLAETYGTWDDCVSCYVLARSTKGARVLEPIGTKVDQKGAEDARTLLRAADSLERAARTIMGLMAYEEGRAAAAREPQATYAGIMSEPVIRALERLALALDPAVMTVLTER